MDVPRFHTRHIPERHLDFASLKAHEIKRSGLCDLVEGDRLCRLRDVGVEVVSTQVVWWELEPEPGVFDWSRIERDIARIERAGMKVGICPWFHYPPDWYLTSRPDHACFQCLEHGTSTNILSLWDPRTLEVYERLYGQLWERLGSAVTYVSVGLSGDAGDVSYPAGATHYSFSPEHSHVGYWCGDAEARASFARAMQGKYVEVEELNEAWGTAYECWEEDLMPRVPFRAIALVERSDFMRWYTRSLMEFLSRVCGVFRRCFRNVAASVSCGSVSEELAAGVVKSQMAKIASEHHVGVRWRGMGNQVGFARDNVPMKRLSSAAQFYGAAMSCETVHPFDPHNAAHVLYECHANGAWLLQDDSLNIMRSLDVQLRLRPTLRVDPPKSSLAVFYPVETEMLEAPRTNMAVFVEQAANLRAHADYDLCDSDMIWDDYLRAKTDLLFLVSCNIPHYTAELIVDFVVNGGRVWFYAGSVLSQLFGGDDLASLAAAAGCITYTHPVPSKPGLYHVDEWPAFEPYASLKKAGDQSGESYVTVHEEHVSTYLPVERQILLSSGS